MTRPVDVFAPFGEALTLVRENLGALLPLIVPLTLFQTGSFGVSVGIQVGIFTNPEAAESLQLASNAFSCVQSPVSFLLSLAVARVTLHLARTGEVDLNQALSRRLDYFWAFLTLLVASILYLIGCCMLVVPMFIVMVLLYPVTVLAAEAEGPSFDVLSRSLELTQPHFLLLAVQYLVIGVLALLALVLTLSLGSGAMAVYTSLVMCLTTIAMEKALE